MSHSALIFQRLAQLRVFVRVDRVEAAKTMGLISSKPGNAWMAAVVVGDGVADLRVRDILDIGDDESNFARHRSSISTGFGVRTPRVST